MGKLAAKLDKWIEANKPQCPVGKLIGSLKPGDRDDVNAVLELVKSKGRVRMSAADASSIINDTFESDISPSSLLAHNGGRCSCG